MKIEEEYVEWKYFDRRKYFFENPFTQYYRAIASNVIILLLDF